MDNQSCVIVHFEFQVNTGVLNKKDLTDIQTLSHLTASVRFEIFNLLKKILTIS